MAIGKGGQNVRLAAKLTGWKIDIEGIEGSKGEIKTEDADKVIEKTVGEDIEEAEVVESGELQQEPSQEEAETARADAEKDMAEELASAEGSAVETEVQEVEEKSEEDQKDK